MTAPAASREPGQETASAWLSPAGDTPADFAALYRRAAGFIRVNGYDGYTASRGYEGSTGASITGALRYAARTWVADGARRGDPVRSHPADIPGLTEELETRLAGALYLAGQLTRRTRIDDLPDQVAEWDGEQVRKFASTRYRYHTEDEAVAVLELAAAMLDAIAAPETGTAAQMPATPVRYLPKRDQQTIAGVLLSEKPARPAADGACGGCIGRGTGERCAICGKPIPQRLRRSPGDPAEYRPGCAGCQAGTPHAHADEPPASPDDGTTPR
jgi:hypothetical protein